MMKIINYIIPSDNWEQQQKIAVTKIVAIISYQAITGNNNQNKYYIDRMEIISYQAITMNNIRKFPVDIISYQMPTMDNNLIHKR